MAVDYVRLQRQDWERARVFASRQLALVGTGGII